MQKDQHSSQQQQEAVALSGAGADVEEELVNKSQVSQDKDQQSSRRQLSYKSGGGVTFSQADSKVEVVKKNVKDRAEKESSQLWQSPYVDVFKHFHVLPSDWKRNQRRGEVQEYFAKEIGRRAFYIEGSITSNNYIQIPNPFGPVKSLDLMGRYIYLQVKSPRHGHPFNYGIDLNMAEMSHCLRIQLSNLFKNFGTVNGFVIQMPLELKNNCWSIVVVDIIDVLKRSGILPHTYLIDGSFSIKSLTICANTHIRGIFTSDTLYDFVTLPADLRFKFPFDLSQWMEYFDWQSLPSDWKKPKVDLATGEVLPGDENTNLMNIIERGIQQEAGAPKTKDEIRDQMRQEIDGLLSKANANAEDDEHVRMETASEQRRKKYDDMQKQISAQYGGAGPEGAGAMTTGYGDGLNALMPRDDTYEAGTRSGATSKQRGAGFMVGTGRSNEYRSGQFSGHDLTRSHKLNRDPIMELKHIIGYQPDMCQDIRWSRQEGENVVLFSSGGTLIAMDAESNKQKRFFFGHTAPIRCFDLNSQGNLIASGQEGKNSVIRLWDYETARCITMMPVPVHILTCIKFSHDGRYLVSTGIDIFKTEVKNEVKIEHKKEIIIIWDIARVSRGEKPEIVAKQTSEFDIQQIKFNPLDPTRLASCGRENIRFWRIRDTANIRGSSVILQHHARDTLFTSLDFEFSFRGSARLDNQGPKRLFVGSKHGTVYQVNYGTEQLEATYKTNDKVITSISVTDSFCVVGSEDSYLRVWPLDFQEFFMEAQHEGPVSAVDISNDGLKIVCGTLYGSIGILDKSNYNYKPLLRSHTDEILAIDFHRVKANIISVSRDKTIRLWDVNYLEQVYEFTSALDQPLSVAAHPHRPTFACGFHSGKLRIFDIDTTEVTDEFAQFKKPLQALKYDNTGKFLITVSEDGMVSIHNAARQHLPIKKISLEMPPEFVHIAFSNRVVGENEEAKQRFAVMGEYGSSISLYDTESFLIQHQIMIRTVVKSFQFANNNKDLLVVTKDCRIKFYNLNSYEGLFLREVANCHRGAICDIDVSLNSGYMLTAGFDNMVKIWDYEAQKTTPYYFQSFIGHTYPLRAIIFNPNNNNQIISVGERDGIYVWEFFGDVVGDYHAEQPREQDTILVSAADSFVPQRSMLEQIRTKNKTKKQFRNQMADDSFILPQTVAFELTQNQMAPQDEYYPSPDRVDIERADRKLTYNHYCNLNKRVDIDVESNAFISNLSMIDTRHMQLDHKLINGYDGFGGVHDNIFWNVRDGLTYFTLNNKLIVEKTKTREQTVFADTSTQLSCMAVSKDMKTVAVSEGAQSPQGIIMILIYDLEKNKLLGRLQGQQKGIQSMAMYENKYLITAGVQGDNSIAVWNLSSRVVEKSALLGHYAINQVKVDPCVGSSFIQFATVGNNASFTVWRYDTESQELALFDVQPPLPSWNDVHFLSLNFTDLVQAPPSTRSESPSQTNYAVIGTTDGILIPFDLSSHKYTELGMVTKLTKGEIGVINIANNSIVFGSSDGTVAHYLILGGQISLQDMDTLIKFTVDSAVMSITMDEQNEQGLIGTEAGNIYYVNFQEAGPIRLVSSNNMNQDAISYIKFDFANPKIFAAACGTRTEQLKLSTGENCDEVMNFRSNFEEYGHVVFVIGQPSFQKKGNQKGVLSKKQIRLIGFSNGYVKVVFFESLTIKHCFKVPLNREAGEIITCGTFSQNQKNFAFGTNHGTLFFGNLTQGKRGIDANYARIVNVGKCNNFESMQQDNHNNTTAQLYKKHTKQMNSDIINDNESLDIEQMDSVLEYSDVTGISSIDFPYNDPISTILIAFNDGSIRLWKSEQNQNLIQVIKLQSGTPGPAHFDIFDMGYQQFDIVDNFDIFQNPDDLEEVSEDERQKIKALYKNKSHSSCQARFFTGSSNSNPPTDLYICWVDALPFLYIRNFVRSEIIKRIPLNAHPSCLAMISFGRISTKISPDAALNDMISIKTKGSYLMVIGTKCGKVVIYRMTTQAPFSFNKLYQSRSGLSYGAITSIDVQKSPYPPADKNDPPTCDGDLIVAGSESGEVHIFELMKRLNEE